jgi:membrane protein YqaA with SNARE-associated domain
MRQALSRRSLEIKYILIGIVLLSVQYYLSQHGLLARVQERTIALIDMAAGYGLVGVFAGAVLANLAILISVPYTAITVTVALATGDPVSLVVICVVTGLGAGIGKIISYTLAHNLAAQHEAQLAASPLLAHLQDFLAAHPRTAPLLVFLAAFTILPDDWVMVPLALIRYPVRRTVLPMLIGKVLHGLSLIVLILLAVEPEEMTASSRADLTLSILLISLLVVLYQIEQHTSTRHHAEQTRTTLEGPVS